VLPTCGGLSTPRLGKAGLGYSVSNQLTTAPSGTTYECCPVGGTCQNGACSCPPGTTNSNGVCCPPGLSGCGGACVNTATDANNCGACGHSCNGGICVNGNCVCFAESGLTACGGTCVNLQSDSNNCGSCGHQCLPGVIDVERFFARSLAPGPSCAMS
jgi:hypothetical protein